MISPGRRGVGPRRWPRIVLLTGIGTLLGLVAGEGLLRQFVPQPGYDLPRGLFVSQPATCYGLRPGADLDCCVAGRTFGVRVNHLGMRGPEPSSRAESTRVLVLGDSTTFGFGVEEEETFVARLEDRLASDRHADVQVMNAGVPGYSTWQSLANLRRLAAPLRPDIVVLAFYEGNDFLDNLRKRHPRVVDGILCAGMSPAVGERDPAAADPWWLRARIELQWVLEQSHIYRLLRRVLDCPDTRRTGLSGLMARSDLQPLLRQVWEQTRLALDGVLLETRRSGAPLVLMALPGAFAFESMGEPDLSVRVEALSAVLHGRLAAWARDRKVPFVATTRALREAACGGSVLLEADRHFNPRGHAVQARVLAAGLEHILPPLPGPATALAQASRTARKRERADASGARDLRRVGPSRLWPPDPSPRGRGRGFSEDLELDGGRVQ